MTNPYLMEVPQPKAWGEYFDAWHSIAGNDGIYPFEMGQAALLKRYGKKDLAQRAAAFITVVDEWFMEDLYALMRFGLSTADYIHHDKEGEPVPDCPSCQAGCTRRLDHPWAYQMIRETARRDRAGELHRVLRYFFRAGLKTTTLGALVLQHIARNPDIRIMYYSRTAELAMKRSGFARKELETNPLLWMIWSRFCWGPEPQESASAWSPGEWVVKRESRAGRAGAEPTLQCSGILAGLKTGGHPDLIVFDDIEDDNNAHSEAMATKTVRNVMAADKIAEAHRLVWYVGTIYNKAGPLKRLHKEGFIKQIWKEPALDFSKPVKQYGKPTKKDPGRLDIGGAEPVYHTAVELQEWRGKTQTAWREYCLQYLCRVDLVSVAELDPARVQWTSGNPVAVAAASNLYIVADPGGFPQFSHTNKISDSVILVVAYRPDGMLEILDGSVDQMGATKRCKELFRLHRKWAVHGNIIEVRWEEGGTGGDTAHIQYMQTTTEKYVFKVVRITRGGGKGQLSKVQRIYDFVEPLMDRIVLRKRIPITHRGDRKNLSDLIVQAMDGFPSQMELADILDALGQLSEPVGKDVKIIYGSRGVDGIIDGQIEPLKKPSGSRRRYRQTPGPTVAEELPPGVKHMASALGIANVPASEFHHRRGAA